MGRALKKIDFRHRVLLLCGVAWLLSSGCFLDCEAEEGCGDLRECPVNTCAECCENAHCDWYEACRVGVCVDTCETHRCQPDCGFMNPDCGIGCCVGEPGCDCCSDADCPEDHSCENPGFDSECVPNCQDVGHPCEGVYRDCCAGLTCHQDTFECALACDTDEDCWALDDPFARDQTCDARACVFTTCASEDDCSEQQQCFHGLCLSPPDCDWIYRCTISPQGIELAPDESAQLSAGAFMQDGSGTPVQGFTWTPHPPGIIDVDDQGVVTAGTYAGTAIIRATVVGCDINCQVEVTALGE